MTVFDHTRISKKVKLFKRTWQLYILILPITIYFVIFHYGPMYGLQIAFRDFQPVYGILGSKWIGLNNFIRFMSQPSFWSVFRNTVIISITSLVVGFPAPIILALMLNEVRNSFYKKLIQTVTYAPYFISTVVLVSMLFLFFSPSIGVVNMAIASLGFKKISFMSSIQWFLPLYVLSGVWQGVGFGAIIYLAALSGVSMEQYEAARVDGANKLQVIWHINIPAISPTIIILLIMSCGSIVSVGFEKIFLMQNPLTMSLADVISTYVYRIGVRGGDFSLGSAIGLFNSIISYFLLIIVNRAARTVGETSLW